MQLFKKLFVGAAASALVAALAPSVASAAPVQLAQAGACQTITGTISRVMGPNEFAVISTGRTGSIHVIDSNARVYAHGLRLTAGNFAAVTGCYANAGVFRASQVTLAGSESAYNGYNTVAMGASGPCHVSLFGTVTENMNGAEFGMNAWHSGIGNIHVYDRGARVISNGLSLNPGVFAGVYGCFVQNGRAFRAEQVTLAPNARAYASFSHPQVSVVGIVDEVRGNLIGVQTRYYGHVHVYTSQMGLRPGERVSVQGTYNPVTGTINANAIAVQ